MTEPILVAKKDKDEFYLLPAMSNRHGVITGATGTGKTVTLQRIAEGLRKHRAQSPVTGSADSDVIHAADAAVKELDITIGLPRKDHVASPNHPALVSLGLADKAPKLVADFVAEFEAIRSLST